MEPENLTFEPDDFYPYVYPVPQSYENNFLASDDEKWAVLESMGIPRRDVNPLVAWRDAVADHNGVPRSQLDPQQGGVLDTGFTRTYTRSFVVFLA